MKHPFLALTLLTILIPSHWMETSLWRETWQRFFEPHPISLSSEGQETTRC